ncbi:MAG: putative secreted protein [Myxococcales bacterium]|nr:putative secreted protein [Myxococcales bacterium]
MISKTKLLASALALVLGVGAGAGCDSSGPERTDRWATTENTNVKIDWDKVNEAYKLADGPEDLEKRINEIYEGDEVISVSVKDEDDKTQVVTGFFDKNTNGTVEEPEKIFTIKREPTAEGAQYQTTGHGAYYGYHSPFLGIASGMMMGMMMSNMFMPSYAPMYRQGYTTNPSRVSQLQQTRSSYRAANPGKFQRSQSGRTYNRPSTTTRPSGRTGGGRMGGGRFGLARAGRAVRPQRLAD